MSDLIGHTEQTELVQRWLDALLQLDATLPRPVAEAMARNVSRSAVGTALGRLDTGLLELESISLDDLAGSEARTILAVLLQMNQRVAQVQAKLHMLWNTE
jgi:hypothetical protein